MADLLMNPSHNKYLAELVGKSSWEKYHLGLVGGRMNFTIPEERVETVLIKGLYESTIAQLEAVGQSIKTTDDIKKLGNSTPVPHTNINRIYFFADKLAGLAEYTDAALSVEGEEAVKSKEGQEMVTKKTDYLNSLAPLVWLAARFQTGIYEKGVKNMIDQVVVPKVKEAMDSKTNQSAPQEAQATAGQTAEAEAAPQI